MQSASIKREVIGLGGDRVNRQPIHGLLSLQHHNQHQLAVLVLQDDNNSDTDEVVTHTIDDNNCNSFDPNCDAIFGSIPTTRTTTAPTKSTTFYTSTDHNCSSSTLMSSKLASNFAELKRLAALEESNNIKRSRIDDSSDDTSIDVRQQRLAEETAILAQVELRRMQNAVTELEAMLADDSLGHINIITPIAPSSNNIEDDSSNVVEGPFADNSSAVTVKIPLINVTPASTEAFTGSIGSAANSALSDMD
jgi:hypothetical protein